MIGWRRMIFGLVLSAIGLAMLRPIPAQEQASAPPADDAAFLKEILEKTAVYSRELNDYAYYYVCREAVTETIRGKTNVPRTLRANASVGRMPGEIPTIGPDSIARNTYLYEYQLVRQKGNSQEKRTLLEKNGQRTEVRDARLEAMRFYFENFAFGPVDLFGVAGRLRHEYRIVGRDRIKGEKAIVVEAAATGETAEYNPGGKVWVREGDNAILKIEWDQTTLKGFEEVKAAADLYNAIPHFKIVTEYGIEKNGIRFPSRVLIREAYVRTKSRKLQTVSEVTIDYKDYKFFQVEVETK